MLCNVFEIQNSNFGTLFSKSTHVLPRTLGAQKAFPLFLSTGITKGLKLMMFNIFYFRQRKIKVYDHILVEMVQQVLLRHILIQRLSMTIHLRKHFFECILSTWKSWQPGKH